MEQSQELHLSLCEEGYLIDPDEWSNEIADELSKNEGIDLNEDHWKILKCMRNFYDDNQVAPDVRHVVKFLVSEHGFDKKSAKKHLFTLFPYGYVKQACKISGMKRPRAWSTG